jgi:hypothetical protein
MLSGGGLLISGSIVDSRDMPGRCLLPDIEPASEAASSWLRLYAADPAPRSGVCLNHDGSLAPNDAAIDNRDGLVSGEEGSGVFVGDVLPDLSGDLEAIDSGRRMLPDCGRCFHERVPERPNAAALATGFFGSVSSSVMGAGSLVRRCSDSSRALSWRGGLMTGVGVLAAFSWTSRGMPAFERSDCGVVGLSGEMERARSNSKYQRLPKQGLTTTTTVTKTHLPCALISRCALESALLPASSHAQRPAGHALRQALGSAARTPLG